jgi:hypothetical protein
VLEIGPYVGGATVAIGQGLRDAGQGAGPLAPFDFLGPSGALKVASRRFTKWLRTGPYYPPYDM